MSEMWRRAAAVPASAESRERGGLETNLKSSVQRYIQLQAGKRRWRVLGQEASCIPHPPPPNVPRRRNPLACFLVAYQGARLTESQDAITLSQCPRSLDVSDYTRSPACSKDETPG